MPRPRDLSQIIEDDMSLPEGGVKLRVVVPIKVDLFLHRCNIRGAAASDDGNSNVAETAENTMNSAVTDARERLGKELGAQNEQISKLEQALQELREQHKKLEETVQGQLDALAQAEPAAAPAAAAGEPLEKILNSVRNLITATYPEQVLEALAEEAEQMGVRGAVFDVRGKSAWGASARGFGDGLSEKTLRGLVVPLNQDTPFRQAFETGGHVDTKVEMLKKNRNILEKLKPASEDAIILLPIRSAGSVSAIFYADSGGKGNSLPVDGLKILSEFAGAQLDRLMALSGGISSEEAAPPEAVEVEAAPEAEEAQPEAAAVEVEPEAVPEEPAAEAAPEAPAAPPQEAKAPPASAGIDLSQLSSEEQKIHKDAKRFAKLLVSEIELYNKSKVADGRKSADLYSRLKTDIERSRQTYAKRFSKTAANQVDYFHEELVRVLAGNDPGLLGPGYPGPSV